MSDHKTDIVAAALSLPSDERADLARRLLLSLEDDLVSIGPAGATMTDIHDRLAAIEGGDFRIEEANAVLSQLRQALASGQQEPQA